MTPGQMPQLCKPITLGPALATEVLAALGLRPGFSDGAMEARAIVDRSSKQAIGAQLKFHKAYGPFDAEAKATARDGFETPSNFQTVHLDVTAAGLTPHHEGSGTALAEGVQEGLMAAIELSKDSTALIPELD